MVTSVLNSDSHRGEQARGLWLRSVAGSEAPFLTNVRPIFSGTSKDRKRGSVLINVATALLFALAIGLYVVSISAQFHYVMTEKHNEMVSWIEAVALDGGMAVASLLALGLSRAGMSARIERLFVVACALGSAAMNLAAADSANIRSVLAYVGPPIFLAAVVDRTVSVIRRHYLGDEDASAWSNLGRAGKYALRLIVAPISTLAGGRRALLQATPLPGNPVDPEPEAPKRETTPAPLFILQRGPVNAVPAKPEVRALPAKPKAARKSTSAPKKSGGESKQARLIRLAVDEHGLASKPLEEISKLATQLAPEVDIHPATARRVLLAHARSLQSGDAR